MTTNTDAATYAAAALLARLDERIVTAELRSVAHQVAGTENLRLEVSRRITAASEEQRLAIAAGDVDAALFATSALVDLGGLTPALPEASWPPELVGETFAAAGNLLRWTLASLPPLPSVLYRLELAAWQSVNRNIPRPEPSPGRGPQDTTAEKVYDSEAKARASMETGLAAWNEAAGNGTPAFHDHLRAGVGAHGEGSYLELIESHAPDALQAAETIQRANRGRHRAKLCWQPPQTLVTPEITALMAVRDDPNTWGSA